MPKAQQRSAKKIARQLENERRHQLKLEMGGKGAREMRRAYDPTLAERRAAALQAEQDRLARERELADKAERSRQAQLKAAAAALAAEKLVAARQSPSS